MKAQGEGGWRRKGVCEGSGWEREKESNVSKRCK